MSYLKRFALFWYDFIVGDSWVLAVGTGVAVGLAALVAVKGSGPAEIILPAGIAATLTGSLWRRK